MNAEVVEQGVAPEFCQPAHEGEAICGGCNRYSSTCAPRFVGLVMHILCRRCRGVA